jgi:hypothetical protein
MIPFGQSLANHLWQSTLVAGCAGLLTLALRTNQARTRHALWLAASVKFLIPFSLLVALGSHFGWPATVPGPTVRLPFVMEEIGQPFATAAVSPGTSIPLPGPSRLMPFSRSLYGCAVSQESSSTGGIGGSVSARSCALHRAWESRTGLK